MQDFYPIIGFIIYGIVFYIQNTQFKKQNAILNSYKEIFTIINIDEIKKFVELSKESLELSYGNRETKVTNSEKSSSKYFAESKTHFNESLIYLSKSKTITDKLAQIIDENKIKNKRLNEIDYSIYSLYSKEFDDIYTLVDDCLNNKITLLDFQSVLTKNRVDFEVKMTELIKVKEEFINNELPLLINTKNE
jgi:FtsZ-interacting cell division protein YlmF